MKVSHKKTFNSIPTGWEEKQLGELGVFSKGKGILKEQVVADGFPCIRYGEIYTTHHYIIKEFKSFITEEVAKESQEIKQGDILFAGSGETIEEIGKSVAYIGKRKAFAGGDVIILSTNGSGNVEYISYALETNIAKKQKRMLGQGQQVVHIYPSDLAEIKIILPPISEQQRIVRLLSIWDQAIEKTSQLIAQKEKQKKWLMQQLLVGKNRLKGFNGKWRKIKLGDLFSERSETGFNDLPLLSITADRGVINQTESDKRDNSNEDKSKYKRIRKGDIGYNTMRMWQGRSALSEKEGIVSPAYTIVVPQKNAYGKFFAYLFKQPHIIHLFFRNSQGLVDDTRNCKFKDFKIITVSAPDKTEQIAITKVISIADEEINMLKTKLQQLENQKRGLMQVLLTGKKRLKS